MEISNLQALSLQSSHGLCSAMEPNFCVTPSALLILPTAPSKLWNRPKKMMTLNGLCIGLSLPCFRFWNFSQTFSLDGFHSIGSSK